MASVDPMPPELEKKLYLEGIQLFNEHEFFEAHETWEEIWHYAYGVKNSFYQGMIQCAVALEHYRRSNPRGVISLYNSYRNRLAKVPDVFMGVDVKKFLGEMHEAIKDVVESKRELEKGEIALDGRRVPKLELMYDPFENGEAGKFDRPERF